MNTTVRVIGTSISEGNMPLLERLTIAPEERAAKLLQLKEQLGVTEILYLPTCNRVEFIVSCEPEVSAVQIRNRLLDFFLADGRDFEFAPSDLYEFSAASAIRHIFRVVSAMESLVIGETQITGQFKSAFIDGKDEYGLIGQRLEPLAEAALLVAKRVRNETSLGSGSLSMASLVMEELESDGPLPENYTVALIGSGEMSRKMAAYLRKRNIKNILFVNRTIEKAEALAAKYTGRAVGLSEFVTDPGSVDAIVSATSASDPILDGAFLNRLTENNSHTVCVDLAIPRDFSTEFQLHDSTTLIDIPYLKRRRESNLRQKFQEVDSAAELIDRAVTEFQSAQIERTLRPVLRRSYQESLEFALENCDKLLSSRLEGQSDETERLVKNLLKKVVGFSSAKFAHAVSAHLTKDFENRQPDVLCENAKRMLEEAIPEPTKERMTNV